MSGSETLGSKGELTQGTYLWNLGYLGFTLFLIGFLYYTYIGATAQGLVTQALGIGFFAGISIIYFVVRLVDTATKSREGFQELDTVGIEEPLISKLNPKTTFIISVLAAGFVLFRILGIGAWVAAPEITVFQSAQTNAIVSGLAGVAEQQFFFYFLFTTLYAVGTIRLGLNPILALIIFGLLVAGIFTGYHLWRYKYVEGALFSVFFFGLINIAGVFAFRSVFFGDLIHFFNNYLVSAGYTTAVAVSFRLI